jgi:hypothetical protein
METSCKEPGCDRNINSQIDGKYCVDHNTVKDLSDPKQLDPEKMGTMDATLALTHAIHRLCDLGNKLTEFIYANEKTK